MTISRKLHFGFGSIVVILSSCSSSTRIVVLQRARRQPAAAVALESVQTPRGGPVEDDADSAGASGLPADRRQRAARTDDEGERRASPNLFSKAQPRLRRTESLRDVLARMEANERNWTEKFAAPARRAAPARGRRRRHGGDLQVFYAEKDPSAWIDRIDGGPRRGQRRDPQRRWTSRLASAAAALTIGTVGEHRRHGPGHCPLPAASPTARPGRSPGRCGKRSACCGTSPKAKAT